MYCLGMSEISSISLDGSINKLTWDKVDYEAAKYGFKDRSKFIQYCIEKTILKKKHEKRYTVEITILMLCFMSFLLLLLIFIGG